MLSVAMETQTKIMQMLFFKIFIIFLPFLELLINFSLSHHMRTNFKRVYLYTSKMFFNYEYNIKTIKIWGFSQNLRYYRPTLVLLMVSENLEKVSVYSIFQSSSSVPPSMRTTHEYTEALKAVRDMSSDDEPRDTMVYILLN